MVEAICKNMKISNNLTEIAFCGLRLSVDSMSVISETIMRNKCLKELTFNFCLIDSAQLESLMPGLCQNISIETLNFACNGFTDKIAYLIAKIVSA